MKFAQYMATLKPAKPASKPGVFYVEHSGHQLSEFVRIIRSSEEK